MTDENKPIKLIEFTKDELDTLIGLVEGLPVRISQRPLQDQLIKKLQTLKANSGY